MILDDVHRGIKKNRKRKRLGRGPGSGHGKTAGRGHKGQKSLAARNLARGRFDVFKVLGAGELTKKLKVSAHRFSKTAQEKIEKAGGEIVIVPGKTSVEEKKKQQSQSS